MSMTLENTKVIFKRHAHIYDVHLACQARLAISTVWMSAIA